MPASLLCDFENANNPFANSINHHLDNNDHRALDFALEFNWFNLGSNESSASTTNNNVGLFSSNINSSSNMITPSNNGNTLLNILETDNIKMAMAKRSQNTTECVPVPSSEHVAEIVGRQGCKIKALRAKTNTYIKTPVRGEEPVFVVTGRKEDVNAAKREILSAAEHFSQIRAQRKNNPGNMGPAPNAHLPGHVTIQVRVPYRVVGLVVGPKGATIKRIQQQTNTYIITPSRDKDPVFEVTGLPDDADTARREIEAHIAIRTGGIIDSTTGSIGTPEESTSDFSNSPLLSSFDNLFLSGLGNTNSLSSTKPNDYFMNLTSKIGNSSNGSFLVGNSTSTTSNSMISDSFISKGQIYKDLCSIFQYSKDTNNGLSNGSSGKNTSNGSYDTDEGIGDSPTFDIIASGNFNSMWSATESGAGNSDRSNNYLQTKNNLTPVGSLSNNLDSISSNLASNLDYNRRSSSLESSINSTNSSSSSSCVSASTPVASII